MSKEALTEEERLAINAKALGNVCVHPWTESGCYPGITLRQLFAAMAMHGLFSSEMYLDMTPVAHAKEAVLIADALLKELAK